MALNLSNLFNYRATPPIKEEAGNVNAGVSHPAGSEAAAKAAAAISRLVPGQTVQGTIMSMDGEGIQLLLAEGQSVKAFVGGGMNLAVGQSLLFTVLGNSQSRLSLSPLFFNMEQGLNAEKALEDAGLPANDRNLALVSSMMEEGMPIDKESLLQMSRLANLYPEEPVQNLVQMARIGMELTPENLEQFAQYKNLEHQLVTGMDSVMEELTAAYGEIEDADQGAAFYKALLDTFVPDTDAAVNGEGALKDRTETKTIIIQEEMPEAAKDEALLRDQEGLKEGVKAPDAGQNPPQAVNNTPLSQVLNEKEMTELLKNLGREPDEADGKLSVQDTLQLIKNSMDNGQLSRDALQKIFDDSSFSKLLKHQIDSQWLLKPEDTENGRNVTALYERLRGQTQKLADAITPFVKEDSAVMKSVTNLRNNVDFMNQLNQMFTYVQLPLKMGNSKAHGDLYVYTNKKSLAKKDGNVSALLHLDMEHLGTMDVYVAMQNARVNTKFYLPDEETIDFLAEHIDELNQRLQKRGYQMNSELTTKGNSDKETTVMEEILKENRNVMAVGVGTYSFDLRA